MKIKKLEQIVDESIDKVLNEDSINAKKRTARNVINAFKNKKHGYNAVQTIGVLTAENPDSQDVGKKANYQYNKDLYQKLKQAHYIVLKAQGHFGNVENPYAIINISTDALSYYAGLFQQTSFVFHVVDSEKGILHSEYWEKQNPSQPYDKDNNPYVKKDESDEWIDCKDADDYYTIIDKKFKYSIPFPMFIEEGISTNIERLIEKGIVKDNQQAINEEICFSYQTIGQAPYLHRGALYHGLIK